MLEQAALIALMLIIIDSFRVNIVAGYFQRRVAGWYTMLNMLAYWVSLSYTLLNQGIHPLLIVLIGFVISWLINFISGFIAAIARS